MSNTSAPSSDPHEISPLGNPHEISSSGNPHEISSSGIPHEISSSGKPQEISPSGNPHEISPSGNPHEISPSENPNETSSSRNPQTLDEILRKAGPDLHGDGLRLEGATDANLEFETWQDGWRAEAVVDSGEKLTVRSVSPDSLETGSDVLDVSDDFTSGNLAYFRFSENPAVSPFTDNSVTCQCSDASSAVSTRFSGNPVKAQCAEHLAVSHSTENPVQLISKPVVRKLFKNNLAVSNTFALSNPPTSKSHNDNTISNQESPNPVTHKSSNNSASNHSSEYPDASHCHLTREEGTTPPEHKDDLETTSAGLSQLAIQSDAALPRMETCPTPMIPLPRADAVLPGLETRSISQNSRLSDLGLDTEQHVTRSSHTSGYPQDFADPTRDTLVSTCQQASRMAGSSDKSLYLTTLARGIPGYHEAEMNFRGEADLHRNLIDCEKHPGHASFTPISTFDVWHLPEGYQDPDIVAYIRAQADLTVRVVSKYTSPDRPDNYAFGAIKGGTFTRTGTGFIQYVYKTEGRTDKPCPCPECKRSGDPKKEWAKVKIRTATHVVFDDVEAKNSVAELFYDNHADRRSGKIKVVYGDNVRFGAIQGDWCDMRCITHDLDLCDYIKDAWGRWRWLESKVNEKFRDQDPRLAVVVSHPHGCNKQVSVGQWAERVVVGRSMGWESSVYSYDTPTCPGSSGAPVWLLGKVRWGGFFGRHPHSGRPLVGLNISATGWDKVS